MDTINKITQKFGLKITDATKMPVEIPNIKRDDLPQLFKELGFKIGAEIGVFQGDYSEKLCKNNPQLKLYCIDSWQQKEDMSQYGYSNELLAQSEKMARERLSTYNSEIIKKTSQDAVKNFEDNLLDFVYIDGSHLFEDVVMDISQWIRKLKIGGIISGHDYIQFRGDTAWCHVVPAVMGYTSAYSIRPWFVLGRKNTTEGEARDVYRSWMWVRLK